MSQRYLLNICKSGFSASQRKNFDALCSRKPHDNM
uniref:Uncharacterized protein n=1 Tax=Anguilla anguilla TaxID=7936 RepID=A0A0E9VJB2_ANGAN